MKKYLCLTLGLLVSFSSWSQFTTPFVFDRYLSPHAGANNFVAAQKLLYRIEDSCIPNKLFKEDKPIKSAGGFAYRMGKLMLLDVPQDYLISLVQHEFFGHVSRMKEAGYKNNRFRLTAPFPYGSGTGSAIYGELEEGKFVTTEQHLAIFTGGNDANDLLANRLTTEIVATGSLHYRQAFLYLISQTTPTAYLLLTNNSSPENPFAGEGNDVLQYQNMLNNKYFNGEAPAFTIKKAADRALVSLANPMLYYSLYTLLDEYGWRGNSRLNHLPMIRLGKVQYLPMPGYQLTPFGDAFLLKNWIKANERVFCLDVNLNAKTYTQFWSVGLSTTNLIHNRWLYRKCFGHALESTGTGFEDRFC